MKRRQNGYPTGKISNAEVVCKNKSSVALFNKLGFRIEGQKRKTFLADNGKIIDTYMMGLVLR